MRLVSRSRAGCVPALLFRSGLSGRTSGCRRGLSTGSRTSEREQGNATTPVARTLKDVTVVDRAEHAAHVVKKLFDLDGGRPVAWGVQKAHSMMTLSAYAGSDVDFGQGPYLLIRGENDVEGARSLKILREYFMDDACGKIWYSSPSASLALSRAQILLRGSVGDLETMATLADKDENFGSLEMLAKTYLKRTGLTPCNAVLRANKVLVSSKRPWQKRRIAFGEHMGKTWGSRACGDAHIVFKAFETLRSTLGLLTVDGDNSPYDFLSEFTDLGSVYNHYFTPLVQQICEMHVSGATLDRHFEDSVRASLERDVSSLEARFLEWAASSSSGAGTMNLRSPEQLRQLLFAPCQNAHVKTRVLPREKTFGEVGTRKDTRFGQQRNTEKKKRPRSFKIVGRGAKPVSHTSSGWPSTSTKALRKLAGYPRAADPVFGQEDKGLCYAVDDLLFARYLRTAETAFVKSISDLVGDDGRAHLSFSFNSETGRLQNDLVTRNGLDDDGRSTMLTNGVQAAPRMTLISAEYRDLDMWMLAQVSKCRRLGDRLQSTACSSELGAYELFEDVRDAVDDGRCHFRKKEARRAYHSDTPQDPYRSSHARPELVTPYAELGRDSVSAVYPDLCRHAKCMDAAMAQGGSVEKISRSIQRETPEIQLLRGRWYDANPGVWSWREKTLGYAKAKGYVETMLGRRKATKRLANRMLKEQAEAAALRYIVSGSAGEVVMGALVTLGRNETLRALGWRVLFLDGDTIVLEGPEYSISEALPLVWMNMRDPMGFELGLFPDVDVESGTSVAAIKAARESSRVSESSMEVCTARRNLRI